MSNSWLQCQLTCCLIPGKSASGLSGTRDSMAAVPSKVMSVTGTPSFLTTLREPFQRVKFVAHRDVAHAVRNVRIDPEEHWQEFFLAWL